MTWKEPCSWNITRSQRSGLNHILRHRNADLKKLLGELHHLLDFYLSHSSFSLWQLLLSDIESEPHCHISAVRTDSPQLSQFDWSCHCLAAPESWISIYLPFYFFFFFVSMHLLVYGVFFPIVFLDKPLESVQGFMSHKTLQYK